MVVGERGKDHATEKVAEPAEPCNREGSGAGGTMRQRGLRGLVEQNGRRGGGTWWRCAAAESGGTGAMRRAGYLISFSRLVLTRLATSISRWVKVCWYTVLSMLVVAWPMRCMAYLSGTPRESMTEAL